MKKEEAFTTGIDPKESRNNVSNTAKNNWQRIRGKTTKNEENMVKNINEITPDMLLNWINKENTEHAGNEIIPYSNNLVGIIQKVKEQKGFNEVPIYIHMEDNWLDTLKDDPKIIAKIKDFNCADEITFDSEQSLERFRDLASENIKMKSGAVILLSLKESREFHGNFKTATEKPINKKRLSEAIGPKEQIPKTRPRVSRKKRI
jgi:hypothetical protein